MNKNQKEDKTASYQEDPILVILYSNGVVEIKDSSGKSDYYFKEDLKLMEKNKSLIIEPFSPYIKDFGEIISARFFRSWSEIKISDLK